MHLTGPEKAAFFVLSLDEEQAAPLLAKMQDEELQKLHYCAQKLSRARIAPQMLHEIYAEFIKGISGDLPMLRGGSDYLTQLLKRALGEERTHLLLRAPPPQSGPLDDVASDGGTLAEMLAQEHPQTIAAVLSQLDPVVASEVLATFPEEMQEQIVERMAALSSISPMAIRATRDTLSTELGDSLSQAEATAGISRVAAILNEMLPEQSAALLAKIETRSPERAAEIRREQFTFADLAKLDRKGMQSLLREVDANQLMVALKTALPEMRDKIFASMSSRAAETLREDMQNMGPQRLADVEKAQREIINTAMRLQGEGKLILLTGQIV